MKKAIFTIAAALCMMACGDDTVNIYATLHGVVTDSETAEPVSGASIVLSPGGKTKPPTGTDGRYEFTDLDAQQYTITVQKTGYQTNYKTVTAVSGESTEANIPLTKSE
jgi:hypothetical protein